MPKTRTLIVDDHPMMRQGLRELFSSEPDLEITAELADIPEALKHARKNPPDLAVIDISLPSGSGLDLAKQLLALQPQTRILFVSMHDDEVYAERAIRAGALGYINKSQPGDQILGAIRKVIRGQLAIDQSIADTLVRRGINLQTQPATGIESLSDRELEIFQLIGQGLGTRAIAERLSLSVKTIESHREHIKSKLNLASATDLAHQATLWHAQTT